MLAGLFIVWVVFVAWTRPNEAPALPPEARSLRGGQLALKVVRSLVPPLFLILLVLGTIFFGIATPTEAGAMGAMGAMLLAALNRRLNLKALRDTMDQTVQLTSMVFIILVGATAFSMVFTALRGDKIVDDFLLNLPGGQWGFLFFTMLVIFLLGFFIDFIEITFIVVPFVAPIALRFFGPDMMTWFGVVVAMNLQASFLTPPFGFALFYLKGVAPPQIATRHIYAGIIPFIVIQLIALLIIVLAPGLVTWLPGLAAN
jgi:tripartite ATP-independent transporter DctM subunit